MELWYTEEHTKNVRFSIKIDKQLVSAKSDFQRIDIFESPEFGRFLTLDGFMMLTEKDEFIYHEMITHVPMAVNPKAKKIMNILREVIWWKLTRWLSTFVVNIYLRQRISSMIREFIFIMRMD